MRILRKGFTLLEVVVTILILGIIAYLLFFNTINKVFEAEYVDGLKKAHNELSQALTKIGTHIHAGTGIGESYSKALRNDFCTEMKCSNTDITSNIFGPADYKWYKGENMGWPGSRDIIPAAVTAKGYLIRFYSYADCDHANINACGYIDVDINGKNGPNMVGKDFYSFWIIKNKGIYLILPVGTLADGYNCSINSWGCTAVRLYNPENLP